MIRIGKMTDYGIVLLTHFSKGQEKPVLKARDLAEVSQLPFPTVSKILKSLCRGGLLVSLRGIKGGYQLARDPEHITVAEIVQLMEGPIGLTECSAPPTNNVCDLTGCCPVKDNWQIISQSVRGALEKLTLRDMCRPVTEMTPPMDRVSGERSGA